MRLLTIRRAGLLLALNLLCSVPLTLAQTPQIQPIDIPSLTDRGEGLTIRHRSPETGLARFAASPGRGVRLALPAFASAEARAREFVVSYGAPFGLVNAEQVVVTRVVPADVVGEEHVRFRQMHLGVPVTGGEFIVHLRGNRVASANGSIAVNLPDEVRPTIQPAAALEATRLLLADLAPREVSPSFTEPRLEILDRTLLGERSPGQPRLTWFIEVIGDALREFIWVDAQTGTVLHHFSQLTELKARAVYSAEGTSTLPGVLVRFEFGPASGDVDADLAFDYAGATYDYFSERHDRSSFDDASGIMSSTVHYRTDVSTPCANAFWNSARVVFCDGYSWADDVVAHEWTHAVTEHSANLFYVNESGALNESYSDIFGETVDLLTPSPADGGSVAWKIGEAIGALRDMANPTTLGDPGSVSDPAVWCGPEDRGGVHSNSGIPNHAFALMVSGGAESGISVAGIGLTKAARVQYRALTTYLGQTSRFADNAVALRESCAALVGVDFGDNETMTVNDCVQVALAVEAVQMEAPLCRISPVYLASWGYLGLGSYSGRWTATYPATGVTQTALSQGAWDPARVDPLPFGNDHAFPPIPFPLRKLGPGQWVPQQTSFARTAGSSADPTYTATWATTFSLSSGGTVSGTMHFHDTGFYQEDGSPRGRSDREFQWRIDLETREASVSGYNDTTYIPYLGAPYSVNDVNRYDYRGSITVAYDSHSQYELPPGAGSLTTINATPNGAPPLLSRLLRDAPSANRLAADGHAAVLVVFRADTPDPVTLTVTQPAGASNLGLTEYTPQALTDVMGGRASQLTLTPEAPCGNAPEGAQACLFLAMLWAPDAMIPQAPVGGGGAYLGVPVGLTATQAQRDPVSTTILVVPPPLVLTAGAWDRTETDWGAFRPWLRSRYPHDVIVTSEYDRATSDARSQLAQTAFVSAVGAALVQAHSAGLAARKVDVVAHGTGGLVVRCTLETTSDCNGSVAPWPALLSQYGPVHQAVFVGTPHLESPLLQDFWEHKDDTNGASHPLMAALCAGCTLGEALGRIAGAPLGQGALDFIWGAGDAGVNKPYGVTYRSIAGIAPVDPKSPTEDLLDTISLAYRSKSLATQFTQKPHDTIVDRDSQRGSVQAGSVTYADIPDVVHRSADGALAETHSEAVWLQALRWLTETQSLFPPPARSAAPEALMATPETPTPVLDLTGYLQVGAENLSVSPDGGVLYAHAVRTFAASSTKTLSQFLLFQRVDDPSDVPLRYTTTAPFELNVRVGRLGTVAFTAVGIFDDMTYAVVPLTFTMALPGGAPLRLELAHAPVSPVGVGASHTLRVEALMSSGGTVDVSSLATYTTRSGTTDVFSAGPGGVVTGVGNGFDWLDVTYGGLTASALIAVGPCEYTLGPAGVSGPAGGGTAELRINATAGCAWRIDNDAAWASVSPASGVGNATLTISMTPNEGTVTRFVAVTAGDQRVRVSQFGTGCGVTAAPIPTFTAAGGSGQIYISAWEGCGFTATVDAGWAHATTSTYVIDYAVDPNPSHSARGTTMRIGGLSLALRQDGLVPVLGPNLVQNGDFTNGLASWVTYATPDASYIQAAVVDGELTVARVPPPPGTSNQATVFQNTGAAVPAGSTLRAEFSLGNTATVRRRISVLVLDGNFGDLAVCTFWLPPSMAPLPYHIRMHTTRAWSNASLYFYAATAGTSGTYRIDDVSLRAESTGVVDRTECTDPVAPAPIAAATGSNLLTNGDFGSGALAPWSTYGQIASQITGGVFEFYRPSGTPAGVVLQSTGQPMTAGQIMRAAFRLGNSSSVRKRVTVLLHDLNFSDLSACTFWLPPGTPLGDYTMVGYATQAWANATLSVYPATVGTESWLQLDNATLQRTSGTMTTGTECLEPELAAERATSLSSLVTAVSPVIEARPRDAVSDIDRGLNAWERSDTGGWIAVPDGDADDEFQWPYVLEAPSSQDTWLAIESEMDGLDSWGEVFVRVNGGESQYARVVRPSDGRTVIELPLDVAKGDLVELRFVFHARTSARGQIERWEVDSVRWLAR